MNIEELIESVENTFEIKGRGKVYCGRLKKAMTRKEIRAIETVTYNGKEYKIDK